MQAQTISSAIIGAAMVDFLYSVIAIIFAITIHEFAHAWMANKLGDPTARIYGRLSLNPMRHIDIFGTIIVPLVLMLSHVPPIGWAKPVPFNPENLKYPKRDSALVALAGPFSNLLMAVVFAIPWKYLAGAGFAATPLYGLITYIFFLNVALFAFNVLPFPPLDGSKIIGIFVPRRFYNAYENYIRNGVTYLILFILFDSFVLQEILHFSILSLVMNWAIKWIVAIIYMGT